MTKYIVLKDTLSGGRLALEGSIVEGSGLDKKFPGIYREALNSEEESRKQKNICEKQLAAMKAEIVEEVKAAAFAFIEEKLAEIQKADEQTGNSNG